MLTTADFDTHPPHEHDPSVDLGDDQSPTPTPTPTVASLAHVPLRGNPIRHGVESADLVGLLPPVPSSIRQATQGLVIGASALPLPVPLPEGMVQPPKVIHKVLCYVDSKNIDTAEVPLDWDRCTILCPKPVREIKNLEKFSATLGVTISSFEGSGYLMIQRTSQSPRTERETRLLLGVLKGNMERTKGEISAFFEKIIQV